MKNTYKSMTVSLLGLFLLPLVSAHGMVPKEEPEAKFSSGYLQDEEMDQMVHRLMHTPSTDERIELLDGWIERYGVDAIDSHFWTVLRHVVELDGDSALVILLLERGANVHGDIPFMGDLKLPRLIYRAAMRKNVKLVGLLIEHGARFSGDKDEEHHLVAQADQIEDKRMRNEMFSLLGRGGAFVFRHAGDWDRYSYQPELIGLTPLMFAVLTNDFMRMESLLYRRRSDANEDSWELMPLDVAAQNTSASFILQLLDYGADIELIKPESRVRLMTTLLCATEEYGEQLASLATYPDVPESTKTFIQSFLDLKERLAHQNWLETDLVKMMRSSECSFRDQEESVCGLIAGYANSVANDPFEDEVSKYVIPRLTAQAAEALPQSHAESVSVDEHAPSDDSAAGETKFAIDDFFDLDAPMLLDEEEGQNEQDSAAPEDLSASAQREQVRAAWAEDAVARREADRARREQDHENDELRRKRR